MCISIVEPMDLEKLCPHHRVVFKCHIEQTVLLRWITPSGSISFFNAAINSTEHTNDGKFSAILTKNISGSTPGISFLTSNLTVQPPLDVGGLNGSVIKCQGGTASDDVENTTVIILSGM